MTPAEIDFDFYYRSCWDRVRATCYKYLRDHEDAEDMAQSTFSVAWATLHTYDRETPFCTWVCVIAATDCLDLLRKRGRRPVIEADALPNPEDLGTVAGPDLGFTFWDDLESCFQRDARLTDLERRLLHHRWIEERSLAELLQEADTDDAPDGTKRRQTDIYYHHNKGLQKLRRCLTNKGHAEPRLTKVFANTESQPV